MNSTRLAKLVNRAKATAERRQGPVRKEQDARPDSSLNKLRVVAD
jgi:hypothetical protein